jgi:hypothetical protein
VFQQQQNELKQKQLALRLRNLELRAEFHANTQELTRPLAVAGLGVSGAAAALLLFVAWRRPGRLTQGLGLAKLALRLVRVVRLFLA